MASTPNTLDRSHPTIRLAGGLEGLPEPMDLNAISRAMSKTSASQNDVDADAADRASMTHGTGRNHVVSDRRFGSFWDYNTQGLVLASTYNIDGKVTSGTVDGGLYAIPGSASHPSGPALRIYRFMAGAKPADRCKDDGTTQTEPYATNIINSTREAKFITRQIKRGGFQNPQINAFNADQWFLFRLSNTSKEPDDAKLVAKTLAFHRFVIEANAEALVRRIDQRIVVGAEPVWTYPETMQHITMPAMRRPDGSVYTTAAFIKDHTDADGEYKDEYVPAIACDAMQTHVVLAILPTPTLLNCVNESKYLRETNSASPLGRDEYDEAIIVRMTRAFPSPEKATEFKDNFAKHAMPEASFYIARMNERIPIMALFTEKERKRIPRTYHKQISQIAMVDLPEAAEIKRQMAETQGIAIAHLGPDQTDEENEAEMEKVRRMSRAHERKLKMDALVAKLNRLRAQKRTDGKLGAISEHPEKSEDEEGNAKGDDLGGGGGSKE